MIAFSLIFDQSLEFSFQSLAMLNWIWKSYFLCAEGHVGRVADDAKLAMLLQCAV